MANGRNAGRGKRDSGRDGDLFLALPGVVLDSPGWRRAEHQSRSLLIDLASPMHRKGSDGGLPNGGLMADRDRLAALGWRSVDQIRNAIEDLEACGLLVKTRQGGRRMPTLYAVTWADLAAPPERYALDIDRAAWGTLYRGAYRTPTKPEPTPQASRTAAATAARRAAAVLKKNASTGPSDGPHPPGYGPSHGQQTSSYGPSHGLVSGGQPHFCGPSHGQSLEMPSVQPATAPVQEAAKGSKPRAAPTRKRAEVNP